MTAWPSWSSRSTTRRSSRSWLRTAWIWTPWPPATPRPLPCCRASPACPSEWGDQISQIVLLLQGNTALAGAMQLYLDTVSTGIGTLRQGTSAVREGYAAFDDGIQAMASVLNGMLQNLALLSDAVTTLATQYGAFDTGVNAYTQGVSQIQAGTQQLTAASGMLVAGAHQLYTETSSMQLDEELGSLLDTLSAPETPRLFHLGSEYRRLGPAVCPANRAHRPGQRRPGGPGPPPVRSLSGKSCWTCLACTTGSERRTGPKTLLFVCFVKSETCSFVGICPPHPPLFVLQ